MAIPTKCPQCGKNQWITSGTSHLLSKAVKHKDDGKFEISTAKGLVVRAFVCKNCSNVVLVKETYDAELR